MGRWHWTILDTFYRPKLEQWGTQWNWILKLVLQTSRECKVYKKCGHKRPKNGPEKNFVDKNFPHLKILPLTADEIFDLRYEDGKMPGSNNFRVFIILKGTNGVGNELDNAQSEYGATSSPAPYFFLIRWKQLFGSGAQANKFSLLLSFALRNTWP